MKTAVNGKHFHIGKAQQLVFFAFLLLLRLLNQISKCSGFFCSPAEQQENGLLIIAHKLRGCHCVFVCATVDNW